MKKIILIPLLTINIWAQNNPNNFQIRGTLPWHNFLSGTSTWNLDDYIKYLDNLQKHNMNFIGFHNYTGGGERYATYVEPMIKINYKNIIPEAFFDNSLSSRWGYTPMRIEDFAFGTNKFFSQQNNKGAFGADCSISSKNKIEHYDKAQQLMKIVIDEAHKRNIQVAMGFEFGVHPPEFFSIRSGPDFYWSGSANMIPNPACYQSIEILYATIDNILETYSSIDYIWLWLNEHSFMGVDVRQALSTPSFKTIYDENNHHFIADDEASKFIGVWALEYIKLTNDYLKSKNSTTKLIIGGWGGGNQLPTILKGLDNALPKEIIFSLLNPDLGKLPPPEFIKDITTHRQFISIPWLEGDHQLWHYQPRVNLMLQHVQTAREMNMSGAVAIHWRTEETNVNFEAFSIKVNDPEKKITVQEFYNNYFSYFFGENAVKIIAEDFSRYDIEQWYLNGSLEFYSYSPEWGRMTDEIKEKFENLSKRFDDAVKITQDEKHIKNLQWLNGKIKFALLLNEVSMKLEPSYHLRKLFITKNERPSKENIGKAKSEFNSAPIRKLFETYASSVRSTGELGVLSSLNQKLYREYLDLQKFLSGI